MGKLNIFNSYVKLPEGIQRLPGFRKQFLADSWLEVLLDELKFWASVCVCVLCGLKRQELLATPCGKRVCYGIDGQFSSMIYQF